MTAGLGVTVIEVDGTAAPVVATAATSVAGFLVRSARGVPGVPVHVRGFADFVATFGSYSADAYGAYAVRGFFDNGGSDARVVRVVGPNSRAASVVLKDRAGADTLTVTAGAAGRPDPGAWGNAVSVRVEDHPLGTAAVPAQLVGASAEPFAVPLGSTVSVAVGLASATVTVPLRFTAAEFATPDAASAEEVARSVNRQTTALQAGVLPGGRLVLAATGATPFAARITTTGATALGFPDATGGEDVPATATALVVTAAGGFVPGSAVQVTTRGSVIGTAVPTAPADGSAIVVTADGGAAETIAFAAADLPTPVTAAALAAVVNRSAVRVAAEVTGDGRLVLSSRSEGASSAVAVAAPTGGTADARAALKLDTATPVAGVAAVRSLAAASETYRVLTFTSPLPAFAVRTAMVRSAEVDLVVLVDGVEVERFASLSMVASHPRFIETIVNDPAGGATHVTVAAAGNASGPGVDLPAVGTAALGTTSGTSGIDGDPPGDVDYLGDPTTRTGLEAFGSVPVQLIACPESTAAGVTAGALAFCERRGDAMFVGTVPHGLDPDGAAAYAAPLRGRKVFGALYAPWIQVVNPLDRTGTQPTVTIPPVGQVLGVYARIADVRGAWKAPAGDEARLLDAVGVDYAMTDAVHTALVREGGVNGIRAVPGAGVVVDASRTLSTDSRWLFVGVRRLFNLVKTSLRDGLTWVAQEPHTDALRRSVKFNVVTPFLLGLWRQGAFGSDPPERVFSVRCDASNNSPADVAQGLFTVEVLFYPTKPAESILVIVGQQDSSAGAREV